MLVRGLFSNLEFPYVQLPCSCLSRDALYPIVWECVSHLEVMGFSALALTADGPSCNRKFFKMHKSRTRGGELISITFMHQRSDQSFSSVTHHTLSKPSELWSNSFGHSYTIKLLAISNC